MISPVLARDKLLELLRKGPYDVKTDQRLLSRIGDFLRVEMDKEVIKMTEHAYGKPLRKLIPLMLRGDTTDFADLVPPELKWLTQWMDATRFSEAPGSYHMLSALIFCSVMMDGKYHIDMGNYSVFPPLAGILIGPSGNRKNSAIELSIEILDVHPEREKFRVIQEKITPEALFHSINQPDPDSAATAVLVSPELSVTLGRQSYLTGMVPLLTRLMDHASRVDAKTRSGGELVAYNVGFGFMGGTTEDWITGAMTPDVVKGGFTSRILFAVENHTLRASLGGEEVREGRKKITSLAEEVVLRVQKGPGGQVKIDRDAFDYLENWYMLHRMGVKHSYVEASYYDRKHIHLIRLAMVLCVIEGDYIITVKHLMAALKILEYMEPKMFELFRRLAAPQSSADGNELLRIIAENGGQISRQMLIRRASELIPIGRIREALDFILEAGLAFGGGANDSKIKIPTGHKDQSSKVGEEGELG